MREILASVKHFSKTYLEFDEFSEWLLIILVGFCFLSCAFAVLGRISVLYSYDEFKNRNYNECVKKMGKSEAKKERSRIIFMLEQISLRTASSEIYFKTTDKNPILNYKRAFCSLTSIAGISEYIGSSFNSLNPKLSEEDKELLDKLKVGLLSDEAKGKVLFRKLNKTEVDSICSVLINYKNLLFDIENYRFKVLNIKNNNPDMPETDVARIVEDKLEAVLRDYKEIKENAKNLDFGNIKNKYKLN